jgi:hypothetical protein
MEILIINAIDMPMCVSEGKITKMGIVFKK